MKSELSALYQKHHYFAIVDEVDSILIDEARTPLIISGASEDSSEMYLLFTLKSHKSSQIMSEQSRAQWD